MRLTNPILFIKLGCAIVLLAAIGVLQCRAQDPPHLKASDCIKCHSYEQAEIMSKGGKHKSVVSCTDCHREHLPDGTDLIAPCSRCHSGTPHLDLQNCQECHKKAHSPMYSLQFPGNARTECMTCHAKQGKEVTEFASQHSQLACVSCHPSHDKVPNCLDCHAPHIAGQVMTDCRLCHPTHHPRQVELPSYASISFCKPCHTDIINNLLHTPLKHGTLRCTSCHRGMHPPAPIQCQNCHGLPHGVNLLKKYKSCLSCHRDPHLLM